MQLICQVLGEHNLVQNTAVNCQQVGRHARMMCAVAWVR